MVEPINLNRARKARAKADAKVKAAENRVTFGLAKTVRSDARAETDRSRKDHEGKKRE